ncbi:hypothetical protein FLX56_28395 [Synechococcus moorigangaii CMS01]|nr:hypothetical protein [Synechococcus moorigangaii CMS01]
MRAFRADAFCASAALVVRAPVPRRLSSRATGVRPPDCADGRNSLRSGHTLLHAVPSGRGHGGAPRPRL